MGEGDHEEGDGESGGEECARASRPRMQNVHVGGVEASAVGMAHRNCLLGVQEWWL